MGVEIMIAGVAAAFEAVQTWIAVRDRRLAAASLEAPESRRRDNPSLWDENRALLDAVPFDVLQTMEKRTRTCWERYHEVLKDDEKYLPEDIDKATKAVKACICRELQRIIDVNGSLPPGQLRRWWDVLCSTESPA